MEQSTSTPQAAPLSRLLDDAIDRLQALHPPNESQDGIFFSGNRHESVPRALLVDRRLTPLERNAWQVFRMLLNDEGITAFPTYERLSPYLTSTPCAGKASDETIARALTLLRLTRWLTLVRHRRSPTTGRIQGNLYLLHDESLTPYEAIRLDVHYLRLLSHALTHASKAIRRVACHTLAEITEDPLLSQRLLPSRLHTVIHRLEQLGGELSILAADSEDGAAGADSDRLRNPKQDSTVRTDLINKEIRTVLTTEGNAQLQVPDRFGRLRPEQQAGALTALQQLDIGLQQAVLDEWDARCRISTVRTPAGYLFGVIQKALRGEFRAWASQRIEWPKPGSSTVTPAPDAPATAARRAVAEQNLAKLRAMLQPR